MPIFDGELTKPLDWQYLIDRNDGVIYLSTHYVDIPDLIITLNLNTIYRFISYEGIMSNELHV